VKSPPYAADAAADVVKAKLTRGQAEAVDEASAPDAPSADDSFSAS